MTIVRAQRSRASGNRVMSTHFLHVTTGKGTRAQCVLADPANVRGHVHTYICRAGAAHPGRNFACVAALLVS